MRFHLKNLKLDQDGLSKVLGFLEAEVMDAVWSGGEMSVRGVREELKRKKKKAYSFNTIMTVMNRLVDKKLLQKRTVDGSFAYRAAVPKDSFLKEVTRSVVSAIVADGSLFQAAGFVEALKAVSDEERKLLKKMLDEADAYGA